MDYTSALFQKVPKYLLEKRSQIIMVLFVSIFAVAFINIFQPFGSDTWIDNKNITTTIYFLWSTVLVSIGMIVVAISRVIMYSYSRKPNHSITVLKYIGWVFVELLLLSGAFTVLALIVKGNLNLTTNDPMEIYIKDDYHILGICQSEKSDFGFECVWSISRHLAKNQERNYSF